MLANLLVVALLIALSKSVLAEGQLHGTDVAGPVAVVDIPSGDSRVYYQNITDNSIWEVTYSSSSSASFTQIVPGVNVRSTTPLAVAQIEGDSFQEAHPCGVYFPDLLISEVIWDPVHGFQHGADCGACISDHDTAGTVNGSMILYARLSQATPPPGEARVLRVGYIPEPPRFGGVLWEMVGNNVDGWEFASLP